MSCETLFRKSLKAHGLRMTTQREAILKALHQTRKPVSAESIYALAQQDCSVLDLSTVYRTLDLFQEFGLVGVVNAQGMNFYEHLGLMEPHLHLLCSECGRIVNVPMDEAQGFLDQLSGKYHFHINPTEITFQGLCAKCRTEIQQGEDAILVNF